MGIDWDKLERSAASAARRAGDKTDEALAAKISSFTRLNDEEVMKLFPKSADAKKVAKLMKIVRSSESHNRKVKQIRDNIEEFAGVATKLLKHLT